MRSALGLAAVLVSAVANAQQLPRCGEFASEVTLGPLSGRRIDSVLVETAQPNLGRFAAFAKMRQRTHPDVIRRELLFVPGDTVDTLRVAESLRRLRKLAFLEYARVDARDCPGPGGPSLVLTVITRDGWTARPEIKPGKGSARIGLTERDLFGTGRTVSLDVVSHNRSLGVGVSTSDAFGFGTGVTTHARFQRYYNGTIRALSFARRQTSVTDRWRAALDLWDQRYEPGASSGNDFLRTGGDLIGGLRISKENDAHVIYLLGGAESEYTSLIAGSAIQAQLVGPARVDRRFTGPQAGVSVLSGTYDTLTWLLPGGAVVDIPRTIEGELVIGMGAGAISSGELFGPVERHRTNFMTHYTGWLGHEWLPTRTSRAVADVWASGYSGLHEWQSGRVRAAVSAQRAASNGLWELSLAGEQLTDPDPDVRALSIFDRTLAFVPNRSRLAESALTMSLDRTRHLARVSSSLELDGSVFGALSKRWDPATTVGNSDDFALGVLGVSVGLAPRRAGRATVRLDYGVPVFAPPGLRRSPRVSITLMPWLGSGRHRDKPGTP